MANRHRCSHKKILRRKHITNRHKYCQKEFLGESKISVQIFVLQRQIMVFFEKVNVVVNVEKEKGVVNVLSFVYCHCEEQYSFYACVLTFLKLLDQKT